MESKAVLFFSWLILTMEATFLRNHCFFPYRHAAKSGHNRDGTSNLPSTKYRSTKNQSLTVNLWIREQIKLPKNGDKKKHLFFFFNKYYP